MTLSEYRELEALAHYSEQAEAITRLADTHYDSYNQWEPTEDGWGLQWSGGEKFYGYVEWLEWLIKYFFKPKGIILSGTLIYQGEEIGDVGQIKVNDNLVKQVRLDPEGMVECPSCGHRFRYNNE